MKKNSEKISDPAFADYFYSILYGATIEDKLALPEKYQRLVTSEKEAKKFALNSSMDEKLGVLSYLGIKSYLIISDSGLPEDSGLRAVLKTHRDKQEYLTLKQIIESGLYVTSNKHLIGLLKLATQSIHSKIYRQTLELSRTRYHAKKWDQKLRSEKEEETEDQQKSIDNNYVRSIGHIEDVMKKSEVLFDLKESRMRVLIYLYPLRNTHILIEEISEYLTGSFTKMEIASATKELVDLKHIENHPFSKRREYTITGSGIRIIQKLKDAVNKLNSFNYD